MPAAQFMPAPSREERRAARSSGCHGSSAGARSQKGWWRRRRCPPREPASVDARMFHQRQLARRRLPSAPHAQPARQKISQRSSATPSSRSRRVRYSVYARRANKVHAAPCRGTIERVIAAAAATTPQRYVEQKGSLPVAMRSMRPQTLMSMPPVTARHLRLLTQTRSAAAGMKQASPAAEVTTKRCRQKGGGAGMRG